MDPLERIIVALDLPDADQAWNAINSLGDAGFKPGYKIGYELFYGSAVDGILAIADGSVRCSPEMHRVGSLFKHLAGSAFVDLKFCDIPETVRKAVLQVMRLKPKFINLHASGGRKMMEAARQARDQFLTQHPFPDGHVPKLLAVTVLTSMSYDDFVDEGLFEPIEDFYALGEGSTTKEAIAGMRDGKVARIEKLVVRRARNAQACGLDGVVASAQEAAAIRAACGKNFIIVTPAVRPTWAAANDQKRPTTPTDAIRNGADYMVIGRPILKPPAEVGTPEQAIKLIAEETEQALQPV